MSMDVKFLQAVIVALVMFIVQGAAFCIESPVGSPTMPATTNQSGLIPSARGQYSNAGNDIVTGNVGGGREFRGIVPYGSPAYVNVPLGQGTGLSDVEAFIRRSTGSAYANDRSPGAVTPYYSPPQSVSSLASRTYGNYSIASSSALQIPRMSPYTQPSTFGLVPLEEARKLMEQNAPLPTQTVEPEQPFVYGAYRPLSSTPLEMQQYINEQIQSKLYPTEQPTQPEVPNPLSSLENTPQALLLKKGGLEITEKPAEPLEPSKMNEPTQPGQLPRLPRKEIAKAPGVFEQMEEKVREEFEKNLEQMTEKRMPAEANQPTEPNAQVIEPQAIIGYSRTFASQQKGRFNELMKAGEQYIKDKQYYKAADAYTLAAVYQRNNPLPYAGKAFALFGAGEYMSSAYFLTRAIDIFPDYTRFKVDLASMFGDKDMLQNRITNIVAWQEQTGSPELQFLLAYIYLQTDRLELAQRMTNGALVKMPESKALQMLDKVIRLEIEETKKTGKP